MTITSIPEAIRERYGLAVAAAMAWMNSGCTNTFRLPLHVQEGGGLYLYHFGCLVWMENCLREHCGGSDLENLLEQYCMRGLHPSPPAVQAVAATIALRDAVLSDMARHKPYLCGERPRPAPVLLP